MKIPGYRTAVLLNYLGEEKGSARYGRTVLTDVLCRYRTDGKGELYYIEGRSCASKPIVRESAWNRMSQSRREEHAVFRPFERDLIWIREPQGAASCPERPDCPPGGRHPHPIDLPLDDTGAPCPGISTVSAVEAACFSGRTVWKLSL